MQDYNRSRDTELKGAAKDIQRMLSAQRDRIDALMISPKRWELDTWRERYLDHPLVGTIARRLIWVFEHDGEETVGAWLADDLDGGAAYGPGRLVDAEGSPIENPTGARVRLWHPIDPDLAAGSTDTRHDIGAWRAFFEERGIRQPFKQAHREVYLLTDAERNTDFYSNRFAAHILRQHQFGALAAQRGWRNQLRLMVDAEYDPAHRLLPEWGLRAEFWVEGVGDEYGTDTLESGAFLYLATDQVRLYREHASRNTGHAGGGGFRSRGEDAARNHPLQLAQIPPRVLSEILRDVDLFVGVASVGNNPEWHDGGPDGRFREYWSEYSFGDLGATASTRRELLSRLLPRLAIAPACTLTDRFLVVLGKRCTYKIHLGSGNILMDPGDEYLCIVPNSVREANGDRVMLPFEGDRTLSIILSKAIMLAADDKITDQTILSQINRKVR